MKIKRILSALLAVLMLTGVCLTGITVSAEGDLPFTDVKKNWSYEPIKYVYEAGLMNGTGDGTKFSPNMSLSRAMAVTVLYRNDGSPAGDYENTFLDVPDGKYYSVAAAWAYANGIVTGTGTDEWGDPIFSPNNNITRQELATLFARYAAYRHVDTTKNTKDITTFPDAGKVAKWATDAVKWAVGVGLITGKGTGDKATLSPKDQASRAEFAAIIQRYNYAEDKFTYLLSYETPKPLSTFTEKEYPLVTDADIYVAVDGDDNNPGTFEKPLASFEAAKAKVRELKKTAKDEIKVAFKAGNYGSLETILNSDDSGSADVPVTYCAYGDGDVIFSGGHSIKLDDFKPIEESDKYLFAEKNYNDIYKVDLSGVLADGQSIATLFAEIGLCHEARYPNKNADGTDASIYNMTTTVDKYSSIMLQGALPTIVEGFRTTEGMRVTGFLRVGWLSETFDVKNYDPETKVLTFNTYEGFVPPNGYPVGESAGGFDFMFEGRTDDTVFFHNLSDQLDAPGEYWYDVSTKQLYVYKPDGNYTIATGGTFMNITNADNISLIGLTFDASIADIGFILGNSDNLIIDSCTFRNFAGDQVINVGDCLNLKFRNNEMYNFGATGIYLRPQSKDRFNEFDTSFFSLTSCGIEIDNNYFHDFGFIDYWSGAVNFYCSSGAKVTHNYFKNGAHAAVEFNSTNNIIIEYNVFDNMMMTTADYGAVYTNWGFEDRGNTVRYNLFTNIRAAGAQYGIYIDGNSAGVAIYGNLFYDAGACGITLNGTRDNNIYDNVYIDSEKNEYRRFVFTHLYYKTEDYIDDPSTYKPGNATEMNLDDIPHPGEPGYELWLERWPELYSFHDDITKLGESECVYTTVNTIKNNYLIGDGPIEEDAFLMYGIGKGTNKNLELDENPLFVDPTHGNYSIKDGVDFDLPFEKIGRY